MPVVLQARVVALTLLTGLVAGCGGPSDRPDLGTVSGVVTLNGTPLPNATVTFLPDAGRSSVGITDESGRYELKYTHDAAGAKVGPHTVSISTLSASSSSEVSGGSEVAASGEQVPPQYNVQSTLKEDVQAGANTIDFDLESDGSTQFPGVSGG